MRTIQRILLLIWIVATILSGKAQEKSQPVESKMPQASKQTLEPPVPLPADLVSFFSGAWFGSGEFANGKKIEADITFNPDLDNQWLLYRHADRAPNKYKALGVWGTERSTKKFVMLINDNFGGMRLFLSEGWVNGKIIFEKSAAVLSALSVADSQVAAPRERFTFERKDDDTFKMTYEVSGDGAAWRMGDYLIFRKKH